jgi:NAD(P)-dependent dehydrogenase (short-subunit alcohol dehydrogenase family)
MAQAVRDLTGKVALVTGGGSGIGRGFVLSMAAKGAAVAVVDRNGDAAQQVADEAAALGVSARPYATDVTDAGAMHATVQDVISNLGQLDFLFANAGVLGPAEYLDITADDWDLVLDVNIKGITHTCRAAVEHMMARRQGRIIVTASYNGVRAGAHVIPYRVSKAAAIMYTRCLALVLAPYGVTVNAICPGVTLTPMQLDYAAATAADVHGHSHVQCATPVAVFSPAERQTAAGCRPGRAARRWRPGGSGRARRPVHRHPGRGPAAASRAGARRGRRRR